MTHPNEEVFRELYRAFSAGRFGKAGSLMADDIVWRFPSRVVGGVSRGPYQVLAQFARFLERSGGTIRIEIHDVLGNDEHVVALGRVTAEREGKRLDDLWSAVAHMRDGKVTEAWHHPGDQHAVDEFWS